MPVQFASFSASADAACLLFLTGDGTESLHCQLHVDVTWATGALTIVEEDTQATILPGDGISADTLHATWLIVALIDNSLYLVDQKDSAAIPALLGSNVDFTIWGRVIDGHVESFEQ